MRATSKEIARHKVNTKHGIVNFIAELWTREDGTFYYNFEIHSPDRNLQNGAWGLSSVNVFLKEPKK
jgi:hypothetical protein